MIVKNEEKQIKDFLEHIYDCVDEIIIVDTGSSDDTKKIAATFPKVKTYDAQWENDFAKARNKSLKYAKGEWILVLDADERITGQVICHQPAHQAGQDAPGARHEDRIDPARCGQHGPGGKRNEQAQ